MGELFFFLGEEGGGGVEWADVEKRGVGVC